MTENKGARRRFEPGRGPSAETRTRFPTTSDAVLLGLAEQAIASGWPSEHVADTLAQAYGPSAAPSSAPRPAAATGASQAFRDEFRRVVEQRIRRG